MAEKETWEVVLAKPAWKTYDKADKETRRRLGKCFEELEKNPLWGGSTRPLTGKLKGLYRFRVGDWRVIYRPLGDKMTVEIIAILPRGDAY